MPAHLFVAPAATGKTHRCVGRVRAILADRPQATVHVVLPDRLQVAFFRRRLAEAGGAIDVHVGTFSTLERAILNSAGIRKRVASSELVTRLTAGVVAELLAAGQLPHYRAIAQMPGFLNVVRARIDEFERACVTPEAVSELAARESDPALNELGKVYGSYRQRLIASGWIDEPQLDLLAAEVLGQRPELVSSWAMVAVDGFDSFDAAQRSVLAALAKAVPELLVTLPGTPDMGRPAHRRFANALVRLKEALGSTVEDAHDEPALLDESSVHDGPAVLDEPSVHDGPAVLDVSTILDAPRLPSELAHLERHLFNIGRQPEDVWDHGPVAPAQNDDDRGALNIPHPPLTLLEAATPPDEAREALRWIKARILRDGLRPSECMVVAPDPEVYDQSLRMAATEFGIPVRFSHGGAIDRSPPLAALLDLLEMPVLDWPRAMLVGALRSPYFIWHALGLTREDGDRVDALSRTARVVGGLEQWTEAIGWLDERAGQAEGEARDDEELDLESGGLALPNGTDAARISAGLRALLAELAPPAVEQSTTGWVKWLEAQVARIGFAAACGGGQGNSPRPEDGLDGQVDRIEADDTRAPESGGTGPINPLNGRDRQVLHQFRRVLRAMALAEKVVGVVDLPFGAFVADLRRTLAGTYLAESRSTNAESVLVTRLLEARGARFKAVAVLGLAEGVLPQVAQEDPFLGEDYRAALHMDSRLDRNPRGLFYLAATRADQALLFTRPYLAEDGAGWQASPYWRAVQSIFAPGSLIPQQVLAGAVQTPADAASAQELLFWAARLDDASALSGALDSPDVRDRWLRLGEARAILASRLSARVAGRAPFDGDLRSLRSEFALRFGSAHTWSAGRLEQYAMCPLSFLTQSVLKLEVRSPPELGLDSRQLGAVLHEILEKAYRLADEPGRPDSVLLALDEAAPAVFAAAPERQGFRPGPLWEADRSQLMAQLRRTVARLADLEAGWQPYAFEVRFGFRDQTPVTLALGEAGESDESGESAESVRSTRLRLHGVIDRVDRNSANQLRLVDYKSGSSHMLIGDVAKGRRMQLALYALAARDALDLGEPVEALYWSVLGAGGSNLALSKFSAKAGATTPGSGLEAAIAHVLEHTARSVGGAQAGDFRPTPPAGGCPSYCPAATWCWHYSPDWTG